MKYSFFQVSCFHTCSDYVTDTDYPSVVIRGKIINFNNQDAIFVTHAPIVYDHQDSINLA